MSVTKKSSKSKRIDEEEEEESDDDDEDDEIEKAFQKIKSLKLFNKGSVIKSAMATTELNQKLKKIEEANILMSEKKREKQEKLDKLKTLTDSVISNKKQLDEIEEAYNKKLTSVQVTRTLSKSELVKAEAKLQSLINKKMAVNNVFHELKQAEKVDICFMVDCTGSMGSYINEAKMVIHNIVDKLKKMFNDFSLRMAFVGYKDHNDGSQRVIVLPFTSDADTFKPFVSSISAGGGDDQCEDVFGGLEEVGKLEWTNLSRVLFHIGDAPCHGARFHSGALDSYPAGDPRGLNISEVIRKLIALNICYYFAEINTSTIKMIEEFDKEFIENQGNKINVVKLASAAGITETVMKSVTATIMKTKSESAHLTRGKKLKTILLDTNPISWDVRNMEKHNVVFYNAVFKGLKYFFN